MSIAELAPRRSRCLLLNERSVYRGAVVPRSAAANQELREASRARILDAALTLFAGRGYASTPVDAIVAAAGISPGLLYHYFPSKLDLLRAIFETSMTDVKAS